LLIYEKLVVLPIIFKLNIVCSSGNSEPVVKPVFISSDNRQFIMIRKAKWSEVNIRSNKWSNASNSGNRYECW